MTVTVGVLALQGAFLEHLVLLKRAADHLRREGHAHSFDFIEVRNVRDLARCDALIIPGGESTTIAFVAAQSGLLEPLRDFVKYVSSPQQRHWSPIADSPRPVQSPSQTNLGHLRWSDSSCRSSKCDEKGRPRSDRWTRCQGEQKPLRPTG